MKTLFIGGIKSGKSRLAENYILGIAGDAKPYYLATTEFLDDEMQARIQIHKQQRQDAFITIEEPLKLCSAVHTCPGPVLIECISMWLNNRLYHQIPETDTLQELTAVFTLPNDLVVVHNEVGLGIIPNNKLSRQFADLSGRAAQLMGQHCDRVFFCSAGLKLQMK